MSRILLTIAATYATLLLIYCYSYYFCITKEAYESYLSVLHVMPPPASVVPFCAEGAPADIMEIVESMKSMESITRGSSQCVRVVNAMEVRAKSMDERVVYACASRHAFVMYTKYKNKAGNKADGNEVYAADILGPSVNRIVCTTLGAKYVFDLIARSLTLSLVATVGSVDGLDGVVVCTLLSLDQTETLRGSNVQLLSYATPALKTLLQVRAPFVRLTGTFVTDVYPEYPDGQGIIELACAEDLIVAPPALVPKLNLLASRLLLPTSKKSNEQNESLARNTFYSLHFNFTPSSKAFIAEASNALHELHERFIDPQQHSQQHSQQQNLVLDVPLEFAEFSAAYDGRVRVIKMPNAISGLPLRVGDRMRLTKNRVAENGLYVVAARDAHGATLYSPPVLSDMPRRFKKGADVYLVGGFEGFEKGDKVFVAPLAAMAVVTSSSELKLLPELDPIADVKYDPKSLCFPDNTVTVMELCLSGVDASGRGTKAVGTWDRPCLTHAECPFFEGVRGGCMDSGYCEMPLGVRQDSYKTYSGTPLCRENENEGTSCSGPYAFQAEFI